MPCGKCQDCQFSPLSFGVCSMSEPNGLYLTFKRQYCIIGKPSISVLIRCCADVAQTLEHCQSYPKPILACDMGASLPWHQCVIHVTSACHCHSTKLLDYHPATIGDRQRPQSSVSTWWSVPCITTNRNTWLVDYSTWKERTDGGLQGQTVGCNTGHLLPWPIQLATSTHTPCPLLHR